MKINFSKLFPSLTLPLVVGLTSGYLTAEAIPSWYIYLKFPPLTPPNWVFGPVWTILYLGMGLALYFFWNAPRKSDLKHKGYFVFILQLIANFLWSFFFFGLRSPFVAFLNILVLLALIGVNIYCFRKISRISALILVPYFLWVCFATYLNLGILLLN